MNIDPNYMSRFKVYKSEALFDPDFSLLKENRCPICTNRLKTKSDGSAVYCNGKKHRKNFFMKIDK